MNDSEILSAVKLLRGISDSDTSQDAIINYYISALKGRIVNICGLSTFPTELAYLVVDIIVKKLKDDITDDLDSVNIGDTTVKVKNSTKNIIGYLDENMSELEKFMYVGVI